MPKKTTGETPSKTKVSRVKTSKTKVAKPIEPKPIDLDNLADYETPEETEIFKSFGTALGERRREMMDFFYCLSEYGNVRRACEVARIPHRDIIALRKISPEFNHYVIMKVAECEHDGLYRKIVDSVMVGERETHYHPNGQIKGYTVRDNTKTALEVLKTIDPRFSDPNAQNNLIPVIDLGS